MDRNITFIFFNIAELFIYPKHYILSKELIKNSMFGQTHNTCIIPKYTFSTFVFQIPFNESWENYVCFTCMYA